MQHKRRVLIIFPYEWLAYSPSTLSLRKELTPDFDVRVIAYEGGAFCRTRVELDGVEYVRLPRVLSGLAHRFVRWFPKWEKRWHFFHIARAVHLWAVLRAHRADEVIAADFSGMWVAQKAFRKGAARLHFLSFEIYDSDFFASRIDVERVASVVVQSADRFEWLFPKEKPPVFYVQNAPTYKDEHAANENAGQKKREGIVYCGTALPRFGIFPILEFLRRHQEFRLTMQGLINAESIELLRPYNDLIESGRLVLEPTYMSASELSKWLENFQVGFCFYDFRYLADDQFNYRTIPSGKLFNYFAAGLPVVGLDIPGLNPVREFDAGVLTDDLSPDAIAAAVRKVEADVPRYSANARRAAAHFSFDRMVKPFREFLQSGTVASSGNFD